MKMFFLLILLHFASAANIEITNHQDTQEWWVAFYVSNEDVSCGGTISNVEIWHNDQWTSFSKYEWGYYSFDNTGITFTTPISVRITNSAKSITANNLITSLVGGEIFDFGTNFCCVTASPSALSWKSSNHKISVNGDIISIKGIAWFGADGNGYSVGGLATWYGNGGHSYLWYFDLIQSLGFNVIRLPFSQDAVENNPSIPSWNIDTAGNEIFSGKTFFEGLDIIIDEAGSRGLLIMLDFHSIYNTGGGQDMFYDANNDGINVWNIMAQRYGNRWNVFMIDLFNEPYDVTNSQWSDYKNWCQTVGDNVIDVYSTNWLIGVQGTNTECYLRDYDSSTGYYCYWGENLQKADTEPVVLNTGDRVVYLPHVYGPSINEYNGDWDPVHYDADIWDDHWGFIRDSNIIDSALVIGEWGSTYSTQTRTEWMNTMVDYLIQHDIRDNFFWCLNANSVDTGGILQDDWTTVNSAKMQKLNELQPNPTQFTYDSGTNTVCWS